MAHDWEKSEKYISRYIKGTKPSAMYDIGVGSLPKQEAKTLKTIYPEMQVYGVEPHPTTYLTREKDYPGHLRNIAINDVPGPIRLYLDDSNPDNSSIFFNHKSTTARQSVKVAAVTLDQFDQQHGSPDNILLWMDIEGAELRAIQGGMELLKSGRVKWINMEYKTTMRHLLTHNKLINDLGFVFEVGYNRHGTHEDRIYVLK